MGADLVNIKSADHHRTLWPWRHQLLIKGETFASAAQLILLLKQGRLKATTRAFFHYKPALKRSQRTTRLLQLLSHDRQLLLVALYANAGGFEHRAIENDIHQHAAKESPRQHFHYDPAQMAQGPVTYRALLLRCHGWPHLCAAKGLHFFWLHSCEVRA